jgi:hypothetical protein
MKGHLEFTRHCAEQAKSGPEIAREENGMNFLAFLNAEYTLKVYIFLERKQMDFDTTD